MPEHATVYLFRRSRKAEDQTEPHCGSPQIAWDDQRFLPAGPQQCEDRVNEPSWDLDPPPAA